MLSVTVNFVTVPPKKATLTVDGYGLAGPVVVPGAPAGIMMGTVLVKVGHAVAGVGVGVATGVGVGDATGVGVGVGVTVPHRTSIKMA